MCILKDADMTMIKIETHFLLKKIASFTRYDPVWMILMMSVTKMAFRMAQELLTASLDTTSYS